MIWKWDIFQICKFLFFGTLLCKRPILAPTKSYAKHLPYMLQMCMMISLLTWPWNLRWGPVNILPKWPYLSPSSRTDVLVPHSTRPSTGSLEPHNNIAICEMQPLLLQQLKTLTDFGMDSSKLEKCLVTTPAPIRRIPEQQLLIVAICTNYTSHFLTSTSNV